MKACIRIARLPVAFLVVIACIWSVSAAAQNRPGTRARTSAPGLTPEDSTGGAPAAMRIGMLDLDLAGDLVGMIVVDPSGNRLGRLRDIALDAEDHHVTYALIEFSGAANEALTLVAPWPALHLSLGAESRADVQYGSRRRTRPSTVERTMIVDVDQAALANGPAFRPDAVPNLDDGAVRAKIDDFYRQASNAYAGFLQDRQSAGAAYGPADAPAYRDASAMEDWPVVGPEGELAAYYDTILDLNTGQPVYAVAGYGATLDVVGHRSLVPWPTIDVLGDEREIYVNATRASLERADLSDDQDLSDPELTARIYRQFGLPPYWTATAAPAPQRIRRAR